MKKIVSKKQRAGHDRRQEEGEKHEKNSGTISVRGSTGRKEKFDIDRMTQTTSSPGVSYLMAWDTAESTSNKLRKDVIEDTLKEKSVTASNMRSMVVDELRNRNEQSIASSYACKIPENTQEDWTLQQYESPIGSADSNQHEAYRPIMDNIMHDRSKRYQSATSIYPIFEQS